ncbi:choice-of-anchor B family protein [uncultured Polaribacter sp.]|uniref:choice-of-anchor B family protein n=1 Tax=uncultured Polaribacter sp. TaxID=174711 RepID=UPI0026103E20|nr:choice-of-anchor B family protein [uncultured Polaribacter sp.]
MLKKTLVLLSLLFVFSCNKSEIIFPQEEENTEPLAECVNGFAGIYPCNGYDLIAFLSLADLDPTNSTNISGNDSWGWTDPTNQKEYALMGLNTGISIIDISNSTQPIVVGFLPTATVNNSFRDVKVYNNFAFVVSEAADHGMQVLDLTKLRDITNPPEILSADTTFNGFGSAHNIVINESKGYAYPVGTTRSGTYKGGPLFINIQDPLNPVDEGGFLNYSHDAQVVTYNGPDTEHNGKEILIGSNETEIVIVDVSDKSNPLELSSISYSNVEYTHQGWFTEDMNYFLLGDELDEVTNGGNTRTIIFDFSDLDNPTLSSEYYGPTAAIDHNGYIKGNTYFLANYTAGFRAIDISNIETGSLVETGYFDTFPSGNSASYDGVWNVYPYFESGNIIISDIDSGLFIVKKSE